MNRPAAWALAVLVLVPACGKKAAPTLVGGKPISVWIEALQSPDARVRQKAVDKLGNVGTADYRAFPAVLGALEDSDPAVRQAAIRALPKFGARARDAVAALEAVAARDADTGLRSEAAAALQSIRDGQK